jgi:hypothetical protein
LKVGKVRLQVEMPSVAAELRVAVTRGRAACANRNQQSRSAAEVANCHRRSQGVAGGRPSLHLCNQCSLKVPNLPIPSFPSRRCQLRCSNHWLSIGACVLLQLQARAKDPTPPPRHLQRRNRHLSTRSLAPWWASGCGSTCGSASLSVSMQRKHSPVAVPTARRMVPRSPATVPDTSGGSGCPRTSVQSCGTASSHRLVLHCWARKVASVSLVQSVKVVLHANILQS